MSVRDLVVWGASGHATVVADAVRLQGECRIAGFLDDVDPTERDFLGAPVLGGRDRLPHLQADGVGWIFIAVGDCEARLRLAEVATGAGIRLATVIHPTATVAADAEIGAGAFLGAGSVVGPGATIDDLVIVNTQAGVDHHCVIGKGAHIGPGARTAGGVTIGRAAFLGTGSCVIDHTTVGDFTIIGAGGVVVSDIPDRCVAVGVPARVIRTTDESEVNQ